MDEDTSNELLREDVEGEKKWECACIHAKPNQTGNFILLLAILFCVAMASPRTRFYDSKGTSVPAHVHKMFDFKIFTERLYGIEWQSAFSLLPSSSPSFSSRSERKGNKIKFNLHKRIGKRLLEFCALS